MKIELHCHSTCSDGAVAPAEVARRARRDGVAVFALTDHDTCAGFEATTGAGEMRVLRAVELSCQFRHKGVHLLIYDVAGDERWQTVEDCLVEVAKARRHRLRTMAARLAERGIHIDADAILAEAGTRTVGRPDVAKALVEVGAVSSFRQAFDHLLRDGGPIDIPSSRVTLDEAVTMAASCGARMSIAHPHTLGLRIVREVYRTFKDRGLDGIEVFYGPYTVGERRDWDDVAKKFELVRTGGSDFHQDEGSELAPLGIELPTSHGDALRQWLGM